MEIRGVRPAAPPSIHPAAWLSVGAGLLALVASAVGFMGGVSVHSERLKAPPGAAAAGLEEAYRETEAVPLKPGRYVLTVRMERDRHRSLLGHHVDYTVTSPQLEGWREGGSLRLTGKDRSTARGRSRSRGSDTDKVQVEIPAAGSYAFRYAFPPDETRVARFSISPTWFDYRLPLLLGLALVVGAAAGSRGLRETLLETLSRRSG